MLPSFKQMARFGLTQTKKTQTSIFNHKDTNRLHKTRTVSKKRSFAEVGTDNEYPSKIQRGLEDRDAAKIKLTNPRILRLKQVEKNRILSIRTGMHPSLKEAKDEISKLSIKLKKVEEQSTFWRRKTLVLQKELLLSKNSVSHFSEQVKKLEMERVLLQEKVTAAEEQSIAISDAMRSLIAENNELKETINHMDEELKALMEVEPKSDAVVPDDTEVCVELEKALGDTMADLSDRLAEIEDLKKLLAKVTIEKNLLEEISSKQIMAEIVNINEDDVKDNTVKWKIAMLQQAVEKCMFRIAVLTQKNEELMKLNQDISFTSDQDARMMDVLEDNEKLSILESICMKRYRKLLREAGEKVGAKKNELISD